MRKATNLLVKNVSREKRIMPKITRGRRKRRGLLRRKSALENVAKGVKTTPFYLTFAKIQA